jgi:hypothetical protein
MFNWINPRYAEAFANRLVHEAGLSEFPGFSKKQLARRITKYLLRCEECAVRITHPSPVMQPWAITALASGNEVHWWRRPFDDIHQRLRILAAEIAAVSRVEEAPLEFQRMREKLFASLPRMDIAGIEAQAEAILCHATKVCRTEDYQMERREPKVIEAIEGRRWERVWSLEMLDAVGKALGNCLRQTHDFHEEYWAAFCKHETGFWALFSPEGVPVGVVEVKGTDVHQAKGENNSPLDGYSDDLEILVSRLGLNPETSGDLMALGLFQPTWTRQRQAAWAGDYSGTAIVVWIRREDAVLGIGFPNCRYVTLDLALADEASKISGASLGWACRGFDGAGWTTDDLIAFLTQHLARVAPKVAKRLFSLYVLAAAEGLSASSRTGTTEDV